MSKIMKIISGTLKGRNILVPDIPTIEPVKSEVRNAVFEILGEKILDATCLDLFAGSGSLGLEALSRGADRCVFVEGDKTACNTIQENLNNLNLLDQSEVIYDDVRHFVKPRHSEQREESLSCETGLAQGERSFRGVRMTYDVIFLDPPYVTPTTHLLSLLTSHLQENGIMVYLCGRSSIVKTPPGLEIVDERCYGRTKVMFLKKL